MFLIPANILTTVLFTSMLFTIDITGVHSNTNISCYQCTRQANIQCEPHELKPCPSSSDRCVTHITKDRRDGFKLSRECGQAPCSFDDDMTTKSLGLDKCDRSKDEYFCILCCSESGCNKGSRSLLPANHMYKLFSLLLLVLYIRS